MGFCSQCGSEISEGYAFCKKCGAPVEAPDKSSDPQAASAQPASAQTAPVQSAAPGKTDSDGSGNNGFINPVRLLFLGIGLVAGLLIGVFAVKGLQGSGGGKTMEGAGYDSPEDAVTAYVDYLKDGDFDGMISTFAVESFIDHADVEKYYKEMGTYMAFNGSFGVSNGWLTRESDMARRLNVENRRSYIVTGIYRHYLLSLYSQEEFSEFADMINSGLVLRLDDIDIGDFLEADPKLDTIEVVKVMEFDGNDTDAFKMGMKRQKKLMNADDLKSIQMKLEIDGEDYIMYMNVAEYDGKWYNVEFGGVGANYMGLPTIYGGLTPKDK